MVETWVKALEDVPLRPHIENALDWWFKNQEWPPQASQLRALAKERMRAERDARVLDRYALPAGNTGPPKDGLTIRERYAKWRAENGVGS
jgi:hypothetical protein